jgi:hypothetical protein
LFHIVFFPLLLSIAQSLPNYLSFFICSWRCAELTVA